MKNQERQRVRHNFRCHGSNGESIYVADSQVEAASQRTQLHVPLPGGRTSHSFRTAIQPVLIHRLPSELRSHKLGFLYRAGDDVIGCCLVGMVSTVIAFGCTSAWGGGGGMNIWK